MQFGIMAMQLDALVPRGVRADQLVHGGQSIDHAALVRGLAAQGFKLIELGGDLALFLPHTFAPAAIEQLARLKREQKLAYTVHLPLWSIEPSTPVPAVRHGSVQAIVEIINATRALEPEVYVLHATGALAAEFYRMTLPDPLHTLLLQQFQAQARASLHEILTQTGLASRRLAIETVEFPFELTLALADELDLGICFDTGHVLVGFSGPSDVFAALDRCLPRLAEVHLHDGPWQGPEHTIGYGRDHQRLGRGDLDVAQLMDRLTTAQFSGPIVFELPLTDALASLDYIRVLCPTVVPDR